jgi:acetyl esterase/lipase
VANTLTAVLRWLLLLVALTLALTGLFTAVLAPGWISWPYRLLFAGMTGERSYRYVWLPLVVGLVAWLLRRRHPVVTTATLACCLAAFALLLKPVAQAWWLGRTLPARLAAAFGPAAPDRPPFSLATLYAAMPAPVPGEEMNFSGPLKLDFYRAVGRSPAPCVIFLHGGGWFSGGHHDNRPFTLWLARQGYAVATIDYRLLPRYRWPAPREDVLAAIAFLRVHAAELGLDPNRIVLLGRSAGAQLAEATAYAAHDPGIRGVIAFYGVTDLRAGWHDAAGTHNRLNGWTEQELLQKFLGGTPETAPAAYDSASGLALVGPDSPPTLLIHGGLDSLVPVNYSERLAAKLTAAGRPNALVVVPWASHGFDTINFDGPGTQISTYSIAWFLAAVTR